MGVYGELAWTIHNSIKLDNKVSLLCVQRQRSSTASEYNDGMISLYPGGDNESLSPGPFASAVKNTRVSRVAYNTPGNATSVATSRQKAVLAVEYYNNNIGKTRSSYNDRYGRQFLSGRNGHRQLQSQDSLHRSNSSLELVHDPSGHVEFALRREYGSHGSIDVIGNGESFFAMLQDYRPVVLTADQRSPGPSEFLKHKVDPAPSSENAVNSLTDETDGGRSHNSSSPKLKIKIHKFWGREGKFVRNADEKTDAVNQGCDAEEKQRKRIFAHYDVQSLTANLGYAARLRGLLLARRRNTTTGASAASSLAARSATPDGDSGDEEGGDGRSNELVESCPFFRNEIGGEEERMVSLTRNQTHSARREQRRPFHRPSLSCGVSILEFPPGETHWKNGTCPYQPQVTSIENIDQGALYYRKYFYGQDHQNWFGLDENLGPVAISVKREKLDKNSASCADPGHITNALYQYRLIIRTSELSTLRGSVLEESLPNLKTSSSSKAYSTKEVLEYVAPEITLSNLRLGVQSGQTEEQLLKLDEQGLSTSFKVGIMYCQAGQSSEEDMYNNEEAGPAFLEFLDTIGQKVRLKGFDKYRAGLDNKTDSTGLYSVFARYQDCEIMFHVSTLLPYTANNRQQLLRKRHIGNDIVTIVFQEPGAQPFTPKNIRSQFQHVFIVVRAIDPCTDNARYSVAVSRSKEVPVFGPPIHRGATFPKGKIFADFLLAKVINAEIAAHNSEKFSTMATRTRQEYLKDLATNFVTSTMVETSQKFSMLSFSSRKKDRVKPKLQAEVIQRGAICWQVVLEDSGLSQLVDCFLGISVDSLVLIEEKSREIVMVTPCQAILGWFVHSNSLSVYHHQGECTTIRLRESGDDLMEILWRLRSVSSGCVAQEFSLKRNSMGQLGFHVQPDGIVTQVESNGLAWAAGLRQGSRLVEICKVAVSTLTHDQMVDLLKTSASVMITVIPPHSDGSPRRGCNMHNCKYTLSNYEGDYENIRCESDNSFKANKKAPSIQQAGNHKKKFERSFSPPRSSNSSGYGTGSSSRSFVNEKESKKLHENFENGFHSNVNLLHENPEKNSNQIKELPPPLPARLPGQIVRLKNDPEEITGVTGRKPEENNRRGEGNREKNSKFWPSQSRKWLEEVENCCPKNQSGLPLSLGHAAGFSLPETTPSCAASRFSHGDESPSARTHRNFKIGEKVTCLGSNHSSKTPNASDSLPANCNLGRQEAQGGEGGSSAADEKFTICAFTEGDGNASPRSGNPKLYQDAPNVVGVHSRNASPRSISKESGDIRFRSGATARSGVNSNRNSANLTTSSLQEDLMKLINVDDCQRDVENDQFIQRENVLSGTPKCFGPLPRKGCPGVSLPPNSAEAAKHSESTPVEEDKKRETGGKAGEVILTTARPATVISNASTASSPGPAEKKLFNEERLSPRVTKCAQYPGGRVQQAQKQQLKTAVAEKLPIPLPDPGDMDWPSLVDTATRAMFNEKTGRNNESVGEWLEEEPANHLSLDFSGPAGRRITDLQNQVTQLETRVARETRKRISLEDEVRKLRDENRRLQEESHAAAQQLRRFTEWFFQTIDKQ